MTIQDKIHDRLTVCGIPYKELRVYGSQIMVTTYGRDTADRWASVLSRFARIRGVVRSVDYNVENRNTQLLPTTHEVWRVWATV